MIPRVFVSSTYYDLKHVRERLEKFITSYAFEPVLFESDKVTYEHGKPLDHSAYYEVSLCHVMVLIIGGRYGSPSTKLSLEDERKVYNDEYISITRKELETALLKKIPVHIFIDKNVFAEYQTYKENLAFFELDDTVVKKGQPKANKFKFAHVDDINVFRFIETVKSGAIKTFEKVEEIETYLKLQFAGMFYLYLESLKKSSDEKKILDSVNELNNISLRMNEMLSSVGKKILGNSDSEYKKVIENQFEIVLDFFSSQITPYIEFESSTLTQEEYDDFDLNKAAEIIFNNILKDKIQIKNDTKKSIEEQKKAATNFLVSILHKTNNELKEAFPSLASKVYLKKCYISQINDVYQRKVKPLILGKSEEEKLINTLSNIIDLKLSPDLPF